MKKSTEYYFKLGVFTYLYILIVMLYNLYFGSQIQAGIILIFTGLFGWGIQFLNYKYLNIKFKK